ncbi:MAG: dehydrogenase, partial [Planctomycetales bacterium]|nr:dehydrogenase [Planctomycetales bacterium]
MTAEEELAALQTAEGVEAVLFAAEPLVVNPAAIDVDTHGRVWVAEIQWYRSQAKTNPPADSIKVLEDTDGDGRADKATVFAENVFAPMSICVAGDKVYVATSPDLWVYEDADGDLRADGPPKKLLTGFGGVNHDHGAHSLTLGPDHKWWMAHGDGGFDVRGVDDSNIQFQWGAMLRGELDGSELETVAVNFRNSYEVCVNSFGEAFCSDNDNDGNESVRICWILEGGNYGWFGRPPMGKQEVDRRVPEGVPLREGWHFRTYVPGFVPGTLVTGFGSPCGICFYEGHAFGGRMYGAPLHADAGPQVVRRFPHQVAGYGMSAESEVVLTTERDRYFRPDDVCVAPDGGVYVSDWYDG